MCLFHETIRWTRILLVEALCAGALVSQRINKIIHVYSQTTHVVERAKAELRYLRLQRKHQTKSKCVPSKTKLKQLPGAWSNRLQNQVLQREFHHYISI